MKKGTTEFQISFHLPEKKGFVKAIELEESHLSSFTYKYITI